MKKWKIIISLALVLVVVATAVIPTVVWAKNAQISKKDKELTAKTRAVLSMSFDKNELGAKAELKREISNTKPLNLLNYYGNEEVLDLWSSIPDTQKPLTVLLIIPGHTLVPGSKSALEFLEKTADICEENQIPYAIQSINGEYHNEERIPIAYIEKQFAKRHKYFYGLNAAELYNGVSWRGVVEADNSQYLIDSIKLCAKYGAYFYWTDTNMNYDSGMVLEWFEKNELFYSTFKEYSQYIVMMNKESYGKPSTYSVMQGLWLAGLIGNWGVASDWWHWQVDGDKKSLFGENDSNIDNEWDMIFSYPENMYVQSMLMVISSGATCFKAEAPNFSTSVGGVAVGGFRYGIEQVFDQIIEGDLLIPTKQQVLDKTKAAILGMENYYDSNYNYNQSNLYPSDGSYGILPLLPANLRLDEQKVFTDNNIKLLDKTPSKEYLDSTYGKNEGNTFLTRTESQWYFIHNVENERMTKYARFSPVLASASDVKIQSEEHSAVITKEFNNKLSFSVFNYRTDKKEMQNAFNSNTLDNKNWVEFCSGFLPLDKDGNPIGVDDTTKRKTTITIKGSLNGAKPEVVWNSNCDGVGYGERPFEYKEKYDEKAQTLTITILSNGVVNFDVILDESQKEIPVEVKETVTNKNNVNNNSVKALEVAIEKTALDQSKIYHNYSLAEYNKALEKAKVAISQKTYSKEEIEIIKNQLYNSYDNLIDITNVVKVLNDNASNSEVGGKYDSLLREALSVVKYVNGRSQNLTYAKSYQNKPFDSDEKEKALDKKLNKLVKA